MFITEQIMRKCSACAIQDLTLEFGNDKLGGMKTDEKKESRKTRYTKMALRESLFDLMREKPLLHISLKEICERADISRSTFYTYYNDQFDLLKQIEDEIFEKMGGIVVKVRDYSKIINAGLIPIAEEMLGFIADNKKALEVLFSPNGDFNFFVKFVSHYINQIMSFADTKTGDSKNRYRIHFIIGGIMLVIREWVKNNMDMPIPVFAKLIVKLALLYK
ncbi:MAG: TetR/AcrR family transcriptional regulator [Treponema sp.]|jgi:AcrR family transcriptional regulator|nr:TetR/AcrR family transcriptional regulator [Treponema sp.]